MSSTDNRVVDMQFKAAEFANGVSKTIDALAKLKDSLRLDGAGKGFDDVASKAGKNMAEVNAATGKAGRGFSDLAATASKNMADVNAATSKFNANPIIEGTQRIAASFSALQVIAITALSNIVNKAINAGSNLVKSLTIGPISDGLNDYHTKLTSVQTIMNATGANLQVVNGFFKQLDTYADKTIYNLTDMTSAFAKFTNAGVDMDKSVPAIKGIANMVALAGQDASAASIAMYNLSQSIAGGFLTTTDYKSLNLANVATKEWKDQMIQGAIAAGTLEKKGGDAFHIVGTKAGSAYTASALFNEALAEGWASTDVLLKVLGDYGNEMTDIGGKAQAAAQDVKSFPMMMETLKASVGTGWTDTFEILLGNVGESKALFTGLTNSISGFLTKISDARNNLLGEWKQMGGRTALIDGLKNAFQALGQILAPIGKAFRDIFPATTAKQLFDATERFKNFTATLKPSAQTVENIRRTFAGLFAAFSIGWQIVKAVATAFFDLIHNVFGAAGGADGILKFTGNIGDFVVALDKMVKKSGVIQQFFNTIAAIIELPLKGMLALAGLVGRLFGGFQTADAKAVSDGLDDIQSRLDPILAMGDKVANFFKSLGDLAEKAGQKIAQGWHALGDMIADNLTGVNFDRAVDVINTGLFGALVLMIRKFISGGTKVNVDLSGGLFDTIKGSFKAVTETMQNMQANLKADILLKIAAALGIMAASIWLLSTIDSKKLAIAMGGITAGFAGLTFGLGKLVSGIKVMTALKMPFVVGSLIALAGALLLMAIALKIFATMDLGDTIQALIAMTGALAGIGLAMKLMPKNPVLLIQAAALTILAVALNAIAIALKIFGTMDWMEIGRGLTAMAGSLVVLGAAMKLMPKNPFLLFQAAALLGLGVALNAIALAMKIFATISWDEMLHGLAAMAGSLIIIGGAMRLMPNGPNMVLQAAALDLVAVALNVMGLALRGFAGMSWEEIGKGLLTLAGSLLILAVGLRAMSGAIPGAVALTIAAAALNLLVPVMIALGLMPWDNIIKSLTMLAGVFIILGAAGYVLGPVVLVIIGLGAGLLLIGAAFALAGAGALAFATAFGIVVTAGALGIAMLKDMLQTFIDMIIPGLVAFGQGIVAMAGEIAKGGAQFFAAFMTIISSILDAIIQNIPKIGKLFTTLILTALNVIVTLAPRIFAAGIALILGFLSAIANNIGRIIDITTKLIVNFINGIARNLPKIIQAGFNLIISFMNGIGDAARNNGAKLADAAWNMASGLVEGFISGIKRLAGKVKDAVVGMAKDAWNSAMDWLGINSPSKKFIETGKWSALGMAEGLDRYAHVAAASSVAVGEGIVESMGKTIAGLGDMVDSSMDDLTPVVTPVLDLTQVQKDSSQISRMLAEAKGSVKVDSSYSAARDASAGYSENQLAALEAAAEGGTHLEFTQINNSPKEISAVETYRNTKSLISVAKGALSTVAD